MTTNELNLVKESGSGKMFNLGDDLIQVLQLKGSWYEMGQQYGTFAKDKAQKVWAVTVQPVLDKKWITEESALDLFGRRAIATASHRKKELYRGVAAGIGWPIEKVALLDQSFVMDDYQGKLHSFAGCSSICAGGEATKDGSTYTGRNLDWSKAFLDLPLFFAVYNPTDGSNSVAILNWVGYLWVMTGVNDKGVYIDLHDGSSMGGSETSIDRPNFFSRVFDFLVESDTAEALSRRFNGAITDMSFIWTIADRSGNTFSYETSSLSNNRRRNPEGPSLVVVNTFLNPDWGLHIRDTVSNSLTRYKNLTARIEDAFGQIDAAKTMEIFDTPLFNKDGTFMENGGATKPTKIDADLTVHQIVSDLNELQVWVKIPQKTDWRHVDLKALLS